MPDDVAAIPESIDRTISFDATPATEHLYKVVRSKKRHGTQESLCSERMSRNPSWGSLKSGLGSPSLDRSLSSELESRFSKTHDQLGRLGPRATSNVGGRWRTKAQLIEETLEAQAEVQAIRCLIWEASLSKIKQLGAEPFNIPASINTMPRKLQGVLFPLIKELKVHREALGFLARTFQPWEKVVISALELDSNCVQESGDILPHCAEDTVNYGDKTFSPRTDSEQNINDSPEMATVVEDVYFNDVNDANQDLVTNTEQKMNDSPEMIKIVEGVFSSDVSDINSNEQAPSGLQLSSGDVDAVEAAPLPGRKAFNAVALSWMIRAESTIDSLRARLDAIEHKSEVTEGRLDQFQQEMFPSPQFAAAITKLTEINLFNTPPGPRRIANQIKVNNSATHVDDTFNVIASASATSLISDPPMPGVRPSPQKLGSDHTGPRLPSLHRAVSDTPRASLETEESDKQSCGMASATIRKRSGDHSPRAFQHMRSWGENNVSETCAQILSKFDFKNGSRLWDEIDQLVTTTLIQSRAEMHAILDQQRKQIDTEMGAHQKIIGTLFDSVQSRHQENRDSLDIHEGRLDKLEDNLKGGLRLKNQWKHLRLRVKQLRRVLKEECVVGDEVLESSGDENYDMDEFCMPEFESSYDTRLLGGVPSYGGPRNDTSPRARQSRRVKLQDESRSAEMVKKVSAIETQMKNLDERLEEIGSSVSAVRYHTIPHVYELLEKASNAAESNSEQIQILRASFQRNDGVFRVMKDQLQLLGNRIETIAEQMQDSLKPESAMVHDAMPARQHLANCAAFPPPSSLGLTQEAPASRGQDFQLPPQQDGRPPSAGHSPLPRHQARQRKVRPLTARSTGLNANC